MNKLYEFQVDIFGNIQKYSETTSIARCRIFYLGENRNGGYITKEFADQLISTIPYTPVKGIYDKEEEDFVDHGTNNSDGRIYGIVPKDYNLVWETVEDPDGVTRTYATVDVLIYTELYEEAKDIVGKSQSMELYPKTLQGKWERIGGKTLYVYSHASFFGLQALGDGVEPCFEGASFYTVSYDTLKHAFELLDNLKEESLENINKEEEKKLNIKFKLSDSTKYDLIWSALNPNYNEEGGWMCDCTVVDIFDDYALVYTYETQSYSRQYYTKNEDDTITLGEAEVCFIMDVTETEKNTLETIQALNNNSFEGAEETFEKGTKFDEATENFEADKEALNSKIEECNNSISTLETEKEEIEAKYTTSQETITELQTSVNELTEYKNSIIDGQKQAIVKKYEAKLPADTYTNLLNKRADFSLDEYEREIALEVLNNNSALFNNSLEGNDTGLVPNEDFSDNDSWSELGKYKK